MISQTSEYALRAVVYLGIRGSSEPSSAQEISKGIQVPVGYLQKVLRTLAKQGILIAQRGSKGGFSLGKIPSSISVLDVLNATDSSVSRIEECPLGIKGHRSLCSLHRLLDTQYALMKQAFEATSIADLLSGDENNGERPICDPTDKPLVLPKISPPPADRT